MYIYITRVLQILFFYRLNMFGFIYNNIWTYLFIGSYDNLCFSRFDNYVQYDKEQKNTHIQTNNYDIYIHKHIV
jgi:hypothetical protein